MGILLYLQLPCICRDHLFHQIHSSNNMPRWSNTGPTCIRQQLWYLILTLRLVLVLLAECVPGNCKKLVDQLEQIDAIQEIHRFFIEICSQHDTLWSKSVYQENSPRLYWSLKKNLFYCIKFRVWECHVWLEFSFTALAAKLYCKQVHTSRQH
jgi:hypothetical protein